MEIVNDFTHTIIQYQKKQTSVKRTRLEIVYNYMGQEQKLLLTNVPHRKKDNKMKVKWIQ